LQNIQPVKRGNDLLAHLAIDPHTTGDLQVPILPGWFDAEKHREIGGLHASNQKIPLTVKKIDVNPEKVALQFEFLKKSSPANPHECLIPQKKHPSDCRRRV